MPFNWPTTYPTDRGAILTQKQATDVIRNCTDRSQDVEFARKYGVTPACIAQVRKGRTWWKLRQRLKAGWRP